MLNDVNLEMSVGSVRTEGCVERVGLDGGGSKDFNKSDRESV